MSKKQTRINELSDVRYLVDLLALSESELDDNESDLDEDHIYIFFFFVESDHGGHDSINDGTVISPSSPRTLQFPTWYTVR